MIKIVKLAIQKHSKEVLELLAISDGVPVEEYKCGMWTLPSKLIELFKHKEVLDLFR